jgi:hypothetical protein
MIPGAFGDPFRAVDALPGVTPIASGLPFFYVRGAPPGNVGYFLDGVRVPFLFHVGLGPSVVAPALIDRVDLYAGAYPAQFGRFAGGIVSGTLVPPETEWHGAGEVRLIDVGARIGGPFAGGNGSVFAAARYSYTAAILSLVSPTVELGYWDYQLRASYRPTARDEVSVLVFGSHDNLSSKDATIADLSLDPALSLDTTFHRMDLRYDRGLGGPEDHVRQAITLGYDETTVSGILITDRLLGTRTQVTKRLGSDAYPSVLLRAGVDAELDVYQSHAGVVGLLLDGSLPYGGRDDVTAGAYAEAVVRINSRFEVTPGIRLDLFESEGATALAVDPRLNARLALPRGVRLVAGLGLASQPPSFVVPLPGYQRNIAGGLQRTVQASAGVEATLPEAFEATVTLFQDTFFNLSDPLSTAMGVSNVLLATSTDTASLHGWSAGVEIGLRRRLTRHLGGILAYTLSRSARGSGWGQAAEYDRTHVVSAATLYDFGHGIKGGTRILGYSGSPYWGSEAMPGSSPTLAEIRRLPPFFRLDVRLEKRWALARSAWISLVLEVLNTLFAKETTYGKPNGPTGSGAPLTLPSLAIAGGF